MARKLAEKRRNRAREVNADDGSAASFQRPIQTIAVVPLDERADATSVAANVGAAIALSGHQAVYVSTTTSGASRSMSKGTTPSIRSGT